MFTVESDVKKHQHSLEDFPRNGGISSIHQRQGTHRSAASETRINESARILFISQLRASPVKERQSENTLEVMNIPVCNSLCSSRFVAFISRFSVLSDIFQSQSALRVHFNYNNSGSL